VTFVVAVTRGSTKAEEMIMRNYKETINKHDNMGMLKWVPLAWYLPHICVQNTQLIQWGKKTCLKAGLTTHKCLGNVLWMKVKMSYDVMGKAANVFCPSGRQAGSQSSIQLLF